MKGDFKDKLRALNPSDSVLVGVGNDLKADDGVGSLIARYLQGGSLKVPVIDAGSVPENYLGKIISSGRKNIIFIDALDFRAEPGAYGLFKLDEIYDGVITTHGSSLGFIVEMAAREIECRGFIIGIQPAVLKLGESLSESARKAMDKIIQLITDWAVIND